MKSKSEEAVDMMTADYNCAQSVLSVFCEDLNLDKDAALKLTTGFGAGMARRQEVCGAVSGGIMAIGLKFGRGLADEKAVAENTYLLVGEFMKRFSDKYGSCLCRVLLDGCDLMSESGRIFYKENDLSGKICRPCVADAVGFLEDII
ncbi:MAG: C-GCAxxG-C-C family protein [Acidobacteria bacterium]|nr:C-GCAxxG-C-C family protein [Acidobacteriota bacterium]MBU4306396.1 C-GCAxxG-C-C family protein [Acidobacteriota bacterium]MBU4405346.1 C-GCAxxG-C-C family protein [Acidobacteriota bacterium]MCG2810152.1 C-GCAxxG-C-C family protein [Candidatus Aminicenantes bacterium]